MRPHGREGLRELVHSGRVVRGEGGEDPIVTGVVAHDASEAVFWITCLVTPSDSVSPIRRLVGLDPQRRYRVAPVDVGFPAATYPGTEPEWWAAGEITLTGVVLGAVGIDVPLLHPDEAIVLRVVAV
jgi:alpha-galactosidase